MKTFLPFLLSALLFQVSTAFSQQKDTLPRQRIDFAKVNKRQWAGFKPDKADNGKNAKERTFFSRQLCGRGRGWKGKKGLRGPDLYVEVAAFLSGDSTLLQFAVSLAGSHQTPMYYYVNPRYGRIKVVSDGGDGGDGGKGNNGKKKGAFKNRCGGNGGDGGRGGDAGYIYVRLDSSAVPYVNSRCMTFSNYGGLGGQGGLGGIKGPPAKGKSSGDKPYDGEDGMDGAEGNSSNRVVMAGPDGSMLGWR